MSKQPSRSQQVASVKLVSKRVAVAELRRKAERLEFLTRSDEEIGMSSVLVREGISADAFRIARFGAIRRNGYVIPAGLGGAYGVSA